MSAHSHHRSHSLTPTLSSISFMSSISSISFISFVSSHALALSTRSLAHSLSGSRSLSRSFNRSSACSPAPISSFLAPPSHLTHPPIPPPRGGPSQAVSHPGGSSAFKEMRCRWRGQGCIISLIRVGPLRRQSAVNNDDSTTVDVPFHHLTPKVKKVSDDGPAIRIPLCRPEIKLNTPARVLCMSWCNLTLSSG